MSKRQIGRTLGVDEKTIRNDVADKSAPMPQKPNERRPPKADVADKSALALSGENAARAVEKAEQRAERRLGELLKVERDEGRLAKQGHGPGRGKSSTEAAPLSDIGVDKKLSARAGKLAALPEPEFEADLAQWRELMLLLPLAQLGRQPLARSWASMRRCRWISASRSRSLI